MRELAKAAQCTPKMQSFFVEAVQISHDRFAINRGPCHNRPHTSSFLVTKARGLVLDGTTIPRHLDGRIVQPPSGGWGRLACADNVNMRSAAHSRNPEYCRWYDKG
eukprot:8390330-Pyramimonas_sp.AAC.1